jgi:hypothetical protein
MDPTSIYDIFGRREENGMERLFSTYGEIGNRIAKGVGITYEVTNYTSPTHTKITSEICT